MIRLATKIGCLPSSGMHRFVSLILSFIFLSSFQATAQIQQTGIASFYAKRATGSMTANGERLHHDSMTCAHRTLPFGTLLKVTNLENEKSVIVRVNDRGPYTRGRIIDLSWGAAMRIGMLMSGIAKVYVESADGITIPLLPPTEVITFPKLEIDSIELANSMKPIWQEDLLIDHKKVQRHMKGTTRKLIQHHINEIFKNHLER